MSVCIGPIDFSRCEVHRPGRNCVDQEQCLQEPDIGVECGARDPGIVGERAPDHAAPAACCDESQKSRKVRQPLQARDVRGVTVGDLHEVGVAPLLATTRGPGDEGSAGSFVTIDGRLERDHELRRSLHLVVSPCSPRRFPAPCSSIHHAQLVSSPAGPGLIRRLLLNRFAAVQYTFCMSNSEFHGYVGVQRRGLIALPTELRRRLHLDEPGAQVEVTERVDGVVELRPLLPVASDQAWFWTRRWQEREREVDEHVKAGRVAVHEDEDKFFAHLDEL